MEIRSAKQSDFSNILNIYKKTRLYDIGDEAELNDRISRDPDKTVVAVCDDKVVGVACGNKFGKNGSIYKFAVLPDYQHRGIGKGIMEELSQRLFDSGCTVIRLVVKKTNKNAIDFYRNMGWQISDDYLLVLLQR